MSTKKVLTKKKISTKNIFEQKNVDLESFDHFFWTKIRDGLKDFFVENFLTYMLWNKCPQEKVLGQEEKKRRNGRIPARGTRIRKKGDQSRISSKKRAARKIDILEVGIRKFLKNYVTWDNCKLENYVEILTLHSTELGSSWKFGYILKVVSTFNCLFKQFFNYETLR